MAKHFSFFQVASLFRNRTFWMWMLVLAGCMSTGVAEAQGAFNVKVMLRKQVKRNDNTVGLDTIDKGVAYLFFDETEARKCVNNKSYKANDEVGINKLYNTWEFDNVNNGAYIVVCPEYGIDPIARHLFKIQNGKTFYTYDYPVDADDGRQLVNINVKGTRRIRKKEFRPGPPWEDGNKIVWEIFSNLDRSYLKKNCRFMFVPKAYEYKVDTVIQNIPPAVYDTEEYMRAQQRRMSFDYESNDSLVQFVLYNDASKIKDADSLAVDSTLILNDKEFICKYKFVFTMPDVNKFYYYRAVRELEDYTHVYFKSVTQSSHLRKKPWRFLVTNFAVQYGELDDSFYEKPKVQVSNEPRELALVFRNNSAQLEDNEKNDSIKAVVKDDMQRYRSSLMQVEVRGSASPEGSLQHNIELANKRADFAVSLIRQFSPGVNVVRGQPVVHEWTTVIDRLKEMGRVDIADAIQSRLDAGGKVTKDIAEWNETIEPILSELRAMNCSYMIRLNKPLEPEQAVRALLYDPDYADGGSKTFSQGDYFNIYKYAHKYCDDSLKVEKALEAMTERIYREDIRRNRNNAIRIPFYAYVANRYLADKLKHGTVDSKSPEILKGFVNLDTLNGGQLDSQIKGVPPSKGKIDANFRINRSDHVANLALTHFQLKHYSLADTLSQLLPTDVEYDHKYKAVRMLTLLCSRFLSKPEEAEEGLDYAWNASALSKAVLAVELRGKLDESHIMSNDSIKNLLWTLPDDEPRKWYLMALMTMTDSLDCGKYGNVYAPLLKEKEDLMKSLEDQHLTDYNAWSHTDEYLNLQAEIDSLKMLSDAAGKASLKDSLPDYCAYLQHAFDLDSNYYHIHYMTDYEFDTHVRQKKESKTKGLKPRDYEYNRKLAPEYRSHFVDVLAYMQDQIAKRKEEDAAKAATATDRNPVSDAPDPQPARGEDQQADAGEAQPATVGDAQPANVGDAQPASPGDAQP